MKRQDELAQEVLHDKKWQIFSRRVRLFRHVPYVIFVLGAGSMALGNVDEESDFDVLVGVQQGHIFTARFFSALIFGLRGWRRAKEHGSREVADKICLNHFVTPASYRLRLTPNAYWERLYSRLVPLYGEGREIEAFFAANADWMSEKNFWQGDGRYQSGGSSAFRRFFEAFLGSFFERVMKRYQVRRIERGVAHQSLRTPHEAHKVSLSEIAKKECIHLPPIIAYSDDELEFHPDSLEVEI